jgi:hypothetical protein
MERLVRLSAQTGKDRQVLLDLAIARLERELFLEGLNQDFAALRQNEDAWNEELAERAAWDAAVDDRDGD